MSHRKDTMCGEADRANGRWTGQQKSVYPAYRYQDSSSGRTSNIIVARSNNKVTAAGHDNTMLRLLPVARPPVEATAGKLRRSCDNCVRLKRACNGKSPCTLCARVGKPCCRSAKKRSGPPKGTKYQARKQNKTKMPPSQPTPPSLQTAQEEAMQHRDDQQKDSRGVEANIQDTGDYARVRRRSEENAGRDSFTRRVASKTTPEHSSTSRVTSRSTMDHEGHDPLPHLPPRQRASVEEPSNYADAGTTRHVPAAREHEGVDDGALMLLRTLKTVRSSTSTERLGSAPRSHSSNFRGEEPRQVREQQERLPSLFDMGAVSTPARHPPHDASYQTAGERESPRWQVPLAVETSRPRRLQQGFRPRIKGQPALPSLSARLKPTDTAAAAQALPRLLHRSISNDSRDPSRDVVVTPCADMGGRARSWALSRAVTWASSSSPIPDRCPPKWKPIPTHVSPRTQSGMYCLEETIRSASGVDCARHDVFERSRYYRAETGNFPATYAATYGTHRGHTGFVRCYDRDLQSVTYERWPPNFAGHSSTCLSSAS